MMNTVRAVVRNGRVELLELVDLPEGTEALVTLLGDTGTEQFWAAAALPAADAVWDNEEDEVYAGLLAP